MLVLDLDAHLSRPLTKLPLPGAQDVALSGTLALVACGTGGLQILNLADPARPITLTSYTASPPPPMATLWHGVPGDRGT